MESEDVLKSLTVMDASASLCDDESPQISNGVKESENPGVDFLEDLDSYLEDINDRLIISRMVSDSVIRGMVNAVEQEAAEKIAQKKLEVVRLKKKLHLYHVGVEEKESLGCPLMHYEPESTKHGMYSSFSDALVEHDRMRESVRSLRNAVKEQLKKLKKDIDRVRTSTSIRKISSGSELVGLGLGGILQEKVSEKWMDVDKTFDSLRTTQESIYREVDDMVYLSKASLCQWQLECEFQGEIEDMVIMNCIRSLQEEFEEKLWEQNARFYGNEGVNWVEKMKEISVLRQELDVISKSLSVPELGQLASQGSVENGDELTNSKRTDHLHRKVLGNHVSPSSSLWDGNGKHEESVITMPENLDVAQLKHMSKDDLVNYFKTEMTKMKRNHDYRVQEITEEFFSLKREYLKERGSSLPLRKDKEFEILRKKIPEVIQKLDDILVENEKLPSLNNNAESIGSLKDRLDFLLSENRQLRGLLAERKKEVNRLSSQVSDAAEQHSLAEANLLKMIENLKCSVEDSHIEASISEDVYKYLLREMTGQMKCLTEESNMHRNIMQEIYEIIFRDAAQNAAPASNCEYEDTSKCKYEDSDMESIIMQGLCGVIFKEAFKEAAEKFSDMNMKYIIENELRASLESKAMKNESQLKQATAELMKEKEKLVQETAAALAKEKEQLELASQELNVLRDQTSRQQISILESSVETIVMKDKLLEAFGQIESYKVKIHELKQKLELTMKDLREADSEKRMLLAATQEKQKKLSLVEAKERERCKQMEVLVHILSKAVADFGCRVAEDNKRSNLRMENLSTQLSSLIQKVNILKRTGLLYKQRLERRCSDLQKAEAEVDLLGDEVDTLLSLLEKIYIALDHYSPILQHYPGIIEILKLVRRELSGESLKKV